MRILRYLIILMILSIPVSYSIGMMYLRLQGSSYYEEGCMDGVTQAYLKSKKKNPFSPTEITMSFCFPKAEQLRKSGHFN